MGFKQWFGRKAEEPAEAGGVVVEDAYVGPAIPAAQAHDLQLDADHLAEGYYADDYDGSGDDDDYADEPEEDLRPSWQRKGREYVHFRTLKLVERDGGWKYTIHGRSGKRRGKSELYTEKSNAKRALVRAVKKTGIPARFVPDQYDGAVVYDTNAADA